MSDSARGNPLLEGKRCGSFKVDILGMRRLQGGVGFSRVESCSGGEKEIEIDGEGSVQTDGGGRHSDVVEKIHGAGKAVERGTNLARMAKPCG